MIVDKRTAAPRHIRRDTRLTRAAVRLEQILAQGGAIAQRIKAEWPAWELWRFRRGYRRPGLEGSLAMQKITAGKIRAEHWTEIVAAGKD